MKVEKAQVADTKTIEVGGKEVKIPIYKENEDGIPFFRDGKKHWITVEDEALRGAVAGTNIRDAENAFKWQKILRTPVVWMEASFTGLNPLFPPWNLLRDVQESAFNIRRLLDELGVDGLEGVGKEFWSDILPAMGTIARVEMAQLGDTPAGLKLKQLLRIDRDALAAKQDVELYRQFVREGGNVGSFGTQSLKALDELLKLNPKQARVGTPLQLRKTYANAMGAYNAIFENATRFAAFKTALKKGLTPKEAAFVARNASFDPSRKGEWTSGFSSFYMFFNPALQSGRNFIKSVTPFKFENGKIAFNKVGTENLVKVNSLVYGTLGMAYLWNQSIDPAWNDKIDGYSANYGLPIVLGKRMTKDGKEKLDYFTIPFPFSFIPFVKLANIVYRDQTRDEYGARVYRKLSQPEIAGQMANSVLDGFSIIPVEQGVMGLVPAIPKPLFETMLNRKWDGRKIFPELMGGSNFQKFYDSTQDTVSGRVFINLAKTLSDITKTEGSAQGYIDVSPDQLRYLYYSYLGGAGQFPVDMIDRWTDIITGKKEFTVSDIPPLTKFFRSIDMEIAAKRDANSNAGLEQLKMEENKREEGLRKIRGAVNEVYALREKDPEKAQAIIEKSIADGLFLGLDGEPDKSKIQYFQDKLEEKAQNFSSRDRQLKDFSVVDGQRARRYWTILNNEITDPVKRGQFLQDQIDKKILTPEVMAQLSEILAENPLDSGKEKE